MWKTLKKKLSRVNTSQERDMWQELYFDLEDKYMALTDLVVELQDKLITKEKEKVKKTPKPAVSKTSKPKARRVIKVGRLCSKK
jgi:hypothetical protein